MAVGVLVLSLLFPLVLLGLLLGMERVERTLRGHPPLHDLEGFLEGARPEDVEEFVTQGYGPALERYWRRRRLTRLVPGLHR